jgi:cytochrome b involved in lipid metabolism
LAFGISGGSVISNYFSNNSACETLNNKQYTYEEIEKHNNVENGIWVTYKDGVYDITDFVKVHPGGSEKIMMAAGKSVDPYWNIYT